MNRELFSPSPILVMISQSNASDGFFSLPSGWSKCGGGGRAGCRRLEETHITRKEEE